MLDSRLREEIRSFWHTFVQEIELLKIFIYMHNSAEVKFGARGHADLEILLSGGRGCPTKSTPRCWCFLLSLSLTYSSLYTVYSTVQDTASLQSRTSF